MGAACSRQSIPNAPATTPPPTALGVLRTHGYDAEEVLGEGAFGQVILVEHAMSGNSYACKKLKLDKISNIASVEVEITILQRCRHPNIVFLREALAIEKEHLFLIMELATGGSLRDAIVKNGRLGDCNAASVVIQLASALDYMHGLGVIHRDMKPENVLLFEQAKGGKHRFQLVKLCDFGVSKMLLPLERNPRAWAAATLPDDADDADGAPAADEDSVSSGGMNQPKEASAGDVMQSRVGSLSYFSPELLEGDKYDHRIDMWGLGHILFAALTASHPFRNAPDQPAAVLAAAVDYTDPAWTGERGAAARTLCEMLLCAEASRRAVPKVVLGHSWIAAAVAADRHINLSLRYLGRVANMRGLAYRCLEAKLPAEHREALQTAFDAVDSDAKGYLNARDVRNALKAKRGRRRGRGGASRDSAEESPGAGGSRGGGTDWATDAAESSRDESLPRHIGSAVTSSTPPNQGGAASPLVHAPKVLSQLLRTALIDTGFADESHARSGTRQGRRGARRVGVVSFSMFVEAALQTNPGLIRRLWSETFTSMDADGDGAVGDGDVAACLSRLGIESAADADDAGMEPTGAAVAIPLALRHQKSIKQLADARHSLMADGGGGTSRELLRLVLLPSGSAKKSASASA